MRTRACTTAAGRTADRTGCGRRPLRTSSPGSGKPQGHCHQAEQDRTRAINPGACQRAPAGVMVANVSHRGRSAVTGTAQGMHAGTSMEGKSESNWIVVLRAACVLAATVLPAWQGESAVPEAVSCTIPDRASGGYAARTVAYAERTRDSTCAIRFCVLCPDRPPC